MTDLAALSQRLQQLEDLEAIRQLKARYLNACDLKEIDAIRQCFADGEIVIDYGQIGVFNNREGLISIFNEQGNHDYIADSHHGSNPEITLTGNDGAVGRWALAFSQINSKTNVITQLSGFYDDEYRKINGQWLIVKTTFTVTSSLISALNDGTAQVLFAGRPGVAQ